MMRRGDIEGLAADDRAYVEEHRWPPVSYLKQLEEFETRHGSAAASVAIAETKDEVCAIMYYVLSCWLVWYHDLLLECQVNIMSYNNKQQHVNITHS